MTNTLQLPPGEYFYLQGTEWPPLPVVGLLIAGAAVVPVVYDPAGEFATMPGTLADGRVITRREYDNLLAVRLRRAEVNQP